MIALVFFIGFVTVSGLAFTGPASTDMAAVRFAQPTPTPGDAKEGLYRTYRGVTVRMPAADVAAKLGVAAQHSKAGDYYAISSTESVQISYDTDQTVKAITINISGDLKSAPSAKDVLGEDVKKDADGTISKLVSFPKSGYWASYTRTAGKNATVIITLQKLAFE